MNDCKCGNDCLLCEICEAPECECTCDSEEDEKEKAESDEEW